MLRLILTPPTACWGGRRAPRPDSPTPAPEPHVAPEPPPNLPHVGASRAAGPSTPPQHAVGGRRIKSNTRFGRRSRRGSGGASRAAGPPDVAPEPDGLIRWERAVCLKVNGLINLVASYMLWVRKCSNYFRWKKNYFILIAVSSC